MDIYKCNPQVRAECESQDNCDGTYNGMDSECAKYNQTYIVKTETQQLKAYKNTGLTSSEVEQLKQDNAELQQKLIAIEPNLSCCDEFQCPCCSEVVDESDSYIQCVSCKQVLDWSGI